MKTLDLVQPNRYQDSVTLMQVAVKLRAIEGIDDASLMMGTEPNKEMLGDAGLLTPEGQAAGPNDLIVALRGIETAVQAAARQLESLLQAEVATGEERRRAEPHTLAAGLAEFPEANLVLISTPGLYAAAEARKALLSGRHVMVFSDNVRHQDEQALKALATERGLLLMGPDCGTAIIGGVPLGFANVVHRGVIGVVGASGTGMQEVTSLMDRYGQGISHAIGTGSHDLSEPIKGSMTLAGLKALLEDLGTSVIVLVSKPPHPAAAERVLALAARASKPVVVAFLGVAPQDAPSTQGAKVVPVETLEQAARRAVELAGGSPPPVEDTAAAAAQDAARQLGPQQRYVRGLFSGGTFCYEAMLLLQPSLGTVRSNTPLSPDLAMSDPYRSTGHTCLDLGSDEFTVGRPHPMIDMTARAERILSEAEDPEVAVLLLDVVLGYGAHPNPAGVLSEAIKEAKGRAAAGGRALPVVAHLCGTVGDPQGLDAQRRLLAEVGVILAPSNAAAARLAATIATAAGSKA